MAECAECGKYENLPYQCRRCGQTFCAEHRLPENHDCPGLDDWNDPGGVFDSGHPSGDTSTSTRGSGTLGSIWRSYFRGNVTFVFLALMWLTFVVQYGIAPLFLNASEWASVFVLSSNHPLYVWTWIVSIFAHGGLGHIAANSIGLYFFGPPVERRLGSKRFAAFFLVTGALAGLGQVLITMVAFPASGAAGVFGASGALLAIMGVLTVLNPNLKVYLYFIIPMPLWVLTIGFAVLSVFLGFGVYDTNIANWAHLVGLGLGATYGYYIKDRMQAPEQLQFGGRRGGGPGGRF